jgi:hypothetical protein
MLTTVVDPDAPPVPGFTALVTPVVAAPVPMRWVVVVVALAMVAPAFETVAVPDAVGVPEKILFPLKVGVPARIDRSDQFSAWYVARRPGTDPRRRASGLLRRIVRGRIKGPLE